MSTPEKKTRTSAPYRRTAGNSLTAVARRATAKRTVARRVGRGRRMVRHRSRFARRARVRHARRSGPSTRNFGSFLPDRARVKLVYSDAFVAPYTVATLRQLYRGNSLYDPDITNAGHQPYLYDQYSALYDRYQVYGSSIELEACNLTSQNASMVILVAPTPLAAIEAGINPYSASERPYSTIKMFTGNGAEPLRIKKYMSTRKILGLSKTQAGDQDLSANTSSNPSVGWDWNILIDSADQSTDVTVLFRIKITFYAEFYERNEPTASLTKDRSWLKKCPKLLAPPYRTLTAPKQEKKEEKKETLSLQASEPEEFDLVKVPKKTAVSSKK